MSLPQTPPTAAASRALATTATVLRFLALGVLLFALDRGWAAVQPRTPQVSRRIDLSAERIEALRRHAVATAGRAPDEEELRALIDDVAGEEILYREALRRGFDRDDPVVRQRLVEVMRFLAPDGSGEGSDFYEQALALGLDRSDVVVRRRLIQRLRLAIEGEARTAEVGEDELRLRLVENAGRYRHVPRVRLSQVYLDRGRRGERLRDDADAHLRDLRRRGASPSGDDAAGDALPVVAGDSLVTEASLVKLYGAEFAAAVFELPAGAWSDPIPSPYGLHLVRVEEIVAGAPLPFESAREALRAEIQDERARAAIRAAIAAWRRDYEVVIDAAAPVTPGR